MTFSVAAAALVALAALAAGCGAGGASAPPLVPADRAPAPPAVEPALYEATATVLESRGTGPMLCLGVVLDSLPPQCGDVPLAGWSWEAVEGEESGAGTTWGDFHVVGRFDGAKLEVVEAGPPRRGKPEPEEDLLEPPCPEPDGGWVVTNPGASSQLHVGRAEAYATRQPEYVASWVYHLGDPRNLERGEYAEDIPVVYVAIFTDDAKRLEAEIRARWAGPLCVAERDVPSARDAARLRVEAEASLEGLGLQMLWSQEGSPERVAEIGVVADPGGAGQAALDARFGVGVVRLVPALRPVG